MSGSPERFFYHRSVAPLMWMLVAVMCGELLVDHFLIWLWSPKVAVAVSAVSLAGLAWLIWGVAAMRRSPVEIGDDVLVMRVGTLKRIVVPLDRVAGLRQSWDGAAIKKRSVRNLALIAYPNVVVDMREPLPDRHGTRAVAHRLDDPAAFEAALMGRIMSASFDAASPRASGRRGSRARRYRC